MGVFESCRTVMATVPDLSVVAEDVESHFRRQGYEVTTEPRITGGVDMSLTKGGVFKSVCGLRTALNVEIEPRGSSTWAKASIGIFGQQAIPTIIALFVYWPVILTQIWGVAQQVGLDVEVLNVFENSLRHHAAPGAEDAADADGGEPGRSFCTSCGKGVDPGSRFCSMCGAELGE